MRVRLLVLCALTAALAVGLAPSAWAVIVHLRNGHAASYQPLRHAVPRTLDEAFSNLDYNGGPIMPSNTNYTVYWDPAGAPKYPAGYQAGVDRYLEDLAHDSGGEENVDSVSAQYNDAAGQFSTYDSHFGGELIDADPYPANGCAAAPICLTDAQLQAELTSFVKARGLPTDLEHEYFLLTPPKVEDCFEEGECSAGTSAPTYCAYHTNIAEPEGGELIYADDPYVGHNAGCDDGNHPNGISDSALEGGLSHEHNESITDPEPNNAWTDFGGEGGEIGDKCRTFEEASEFGTPLGEESGVKYNQVVHGHHYWYQQEWSNQTHQCLQRLTFNGKEPTATFTARAVTGTEVSFDASGSSAPGGIYRYNWQFNEEQPSMTPGTPSETTVVPFAHTFPIPCTYNVALTVFAKNGTSIGTAQRLKVGEPPPPDAEIALATPAPTAGEPVSFAGIAENPDGAAIAEYHWDFGDGTPAVVGTEAQHLYSSPGTYEVGLTVTDVCGESHTVHDSVTIADVSARQQHSGGEPTPPGATPTTPAPPAGAPTGSGSPASASGSALSAGVSQLALVTTGKIALPSTVTVGAAGRALVKLTCTGTASSCSGEVVVSVKRLAGSGRRARTRLTAIAAARFTIRTGVATNVGLRLSPLGRRLLRASRGHLTALLALHLLSPAPALSATSARLLQAGARR